MRVLVAGAGGLATRWRGPHRSPVRRRAPKGVESRTELPLAFTGKVPRRLLADE
jgi:hypothetical protein